MQHCNQRHATCSMQMQHATNNTQRATNNVQHALVCSSSKLRRRRRSRAVLCMLHVASCVLHVACSMLHAACCMLHPACCMLHVCPPWTPLLRGCIWHFACCTALRLVDSCHSFRCSASHYPCHNRTRSAARAIAAPIIADTVLNTRDMADDDPVMSRDYIKVRCGVGS